MEPPEVVLPDPGLIAELYLLEKRRLFIAKSELENLFYGLEIPDWMTAYSRLPSSGSAESMTGGLFLPNGMLVFNIRGQLMLSFFQAASSRLSNYSVHMPYLKTCQTILDANTNVCIMKINMMPDSIVTIACNGK